MNIKASVRAVIAVYGWQRFDCVAAHWVWRMKKYQDDRFLGIEWFERNKKQAPSQYTGVA